jgi:alpha-D-ribose 1-methylphosphonate 5-triphosphate diphosphatase PhnM
VTYSVIAMTTNTMTMNQELIKIEELDSDPIDLMPPSNNDMLDYAIMNRHKVLMMTALSLSLLGLGWNIMASVITTLFVLTFIGSFKSHKKDEKKINKLINHYWKLRLEEFKWLGQ